MMELAQILSQPEGFTPPDVTVTIEKVFPYKSGEGQSGAYSFQDIKVNGGYLKLKNLMQAFPESRVGQTVTIRANSSQQHGLTGMKVAHEQYNGKTYDKLIITKTAKWEWAGGTVASQSSNGNGAAQNGHAPAHNGGLSQEQYTDHLLGCAEVAAVIGGHLSLDDAQALQACFATVCIDAKNRGLLLRPKTLPARANGEHGPDDTPQDNPFDEPDEIPF